MLGELSFTITAILTGSDASRVQQYADLLNPYLNHDEYYSSQIFFVQSGNGNKAHTIILKL